MHFSVPLVLELEEAESKMFSRINESNKSIRKDKRNESSESCNARNQVLLMHSSVPLVVKQEEAELKMFSWIAESINLKTFWRFFLFVLPSLRMINMILNIPSGS